MVEIETVAPGTPLGPGPSNLQGRVITVPFGPTAADVILLNRDVLLMGWSIRESTGLGGAVAELYDGTTTGGAFLGALGLTQGQSPLAGKTPASQSTATANANSVATFGGAAGVTAVLKTAQLLALGATGATEVQAVLSGVLGGSITVPVTVPAGVTTPITPTTLAFGDEGLPASGAGVAITLTLPAFGPGNTFQQASVQGYLQQLAGVANTEWFGESGIWCRTGVFLHLVVGQVRGALWIRI